MVMNGSRIPLLPSIYYTPIAATYCIIATLAFILNGCALAVFLTNPYLLRSSNLLLLSMTLCDLLISVLASPVGAYANANKWWTLGSSLCQYYAFMTTWLSLTSILHISALAAERWVTIKLKTTRRQSSRRLIALISGLWWFSLIWSLCPLLGWSSYSPEPGFSGCSITWYSNSLVPRLYISGTFAFFFFIPIIIIFVSFVKTYSEVNRLIKNAAQRWGTHAPPTKRSLKAKIKLARMTVIMTVAFFVAWTPYAIISLKTVFTPYHGPPILSVAASMFAKMSSCYNPIIYFFMYSKFRSATITLVLLRRRGSNAEYFGSSKNSRISLKNKTESR